MTDLKQCYHELEVGPFSSKEEVREAYRLLVNVWHPDRFENNPDLRARAEERFKRINAAYSQIQDAGFPSQAERVTPEPVAPAEAPPFLAQCPWCGAPNRIGRDRRTEVLRCGACKHEFRLEESGRSVKVEAAPSPEANAGPPPASTSGASTTSTPEGTTAQPTRRQSSSAASCLVAGLITFGIFGVLVIIGSLSDKPGSSGGTAPAADRVASPNASTLNDLGNKAADRGDWVQAQGYYAQAARLAPTDSVVWGNLGVAYAKVERFDQAIPALEKALGGDGSSQGHSDLVLWLAACHVLVGQYAEGLQRADQASRLSPNDPEAHFWKARALVRLGRSKDARRDIRAALKLKSDHAGARALLQTLDQEEEETRTQTQAAALAESQARASREAYLSLATPATPSPVPLPAPVAVPTVPTGGRWANSKLSEQERENYLRACLAPERVYAAALSGYTYHCDEDILTAVQTTTLLLHRLLAAGRYRDAIAIYREAAPRQPELRTRVANLAAVYKDKGQFEVAYCLDPSNGSFRTEFETAATERRGYCAESK